MADEPEYYRAQPLPPREGAAPGYGASQGYRQGPGYEPAAGAPGWGQRPVMVNVVGGRSLLLAYVLWFFLGMLGIHKFYLSQPFQGIFYLILGVVGWSTVGIGVGLLPLGLLWLLMLIDIFTMPFRVAVLNARRARYASGY